MAQVALHCLEVIPVLEGQHRECVPQPVDAGIRGTNLSGNLPVVVIDCLRVEVRAKCAGEYKRDFLIFYGLPALPVLPSAEFL